jgi:putative ABC transport system substrate-binding protein
VIVLTIPIVFMNVPDPVGAGFVESMAHPGGNITGFLSFEYSMSGKWAELLKQIAPHVTRALVFRDPTSTTGIGQFAVVRSVALRHQLVVLRLVPKDKSGRIAYVSDFIEEAKATGLVKQTIDDAKLRGLQVAPPGRIN